MRQIIDSPTTQHMLKRSTCEFVAEKPRCAQQVQNLPHTSENAADFHMTDEGGPPLERDVSPDKTDQNKPVPIWQVTLPRRARRIPGPGGTGVKFAASSARAESTKCALRASQDCRAANLNSGQLGPGIRPPRAAGDSFCVGFAEMCSF